MTNIIGAVPYSAYFIQCSRQHSVSTHTDHCLNTWNISHMDVVLLCCYAASCVMLVQSKSWFYLISVNIFLADDNASFTYQGKHEPFSWCFLWPFRTCKEVEDLSNFQCCHSGRHWACQGSCSNAAAAAAVLFACQLLRTPLSCTLRRRRACARRGPDPNQRPRPGHATQGLRVPENDLN